MEYPNTDKMSTEEIANKMDELIMEEKKSRARKNNVVLFIPLFVGIIALAIALVVNSISFASRSQSKIGVSLYQKENSGDSGIDLTVKLENCTSEAITKLNFSMILKDSEGNVLLDTPMSLTGTLSSGKEATTTYFIAPSYESRVNELNYDELWNCDTEDITASFEISSASFGDGKTMLYTEPWYMRDSSASTTYFWIMTLTLGIFVGWMVYAFMTRCPNCKRYFAMKDAGKKEIGRRAGSSVEQRAIKDKYGKVLRYQEETVYGDRVEYIYAKRCKHCGEIKYSRGNEFEKQ